MSVLPLIKAVLTEVVEAAVPLLIGEAKKRLKAKGVDVDAATEKVILAELEALHLATGGIVLAFTPPDKPLGLDESLLEGMDVEVVEPTGDEPTTKPYDK